MLVDQKNFTQQIVLGIPKCLILTTLLFGDGPGWLEGDLKKMSYRFLPSYIHFFNADRISYVETHARKHIIIFILCYPGEKNKRSR